jgi:hypothetical protein
VKRLLPLLFLLFVAASPAWSAASLGGHKIGYGAGSSTTIATGAFSADPVTGSTIACAVGWAFDTTEVPSGLTDNAAGNTYLAAPNSLIQAPTTTQKLQIWYAKNIATTSSFSVTATFSGTSPERTLVCAEIKDADTITPLDQSGAQGQEAPGTSTDAVNSGSKTTTTDGQFIFSASAITAGITFTAGTDFAAIDSNSVTSSFIAEYLIQPSAGAISGRMTTDYGSGDYATSIATFRAATGSTLKLQTNDSTGKLFIKDGVLQVQ